MQLSFPSPTLLSSLFHLHTRKQEQLTLELDCVGVPAKPRVFFVQVDLVVRVLVEQLGLISSLILS